MQTAMAGKDKKRLMPEVGAVADQADADQQPGAEKAADSRTGIGEDNDQCCTNRRQQRINTGERGILVEKDDRETDQSQADQTEHFAGLLTFGNERGMVFL